MHVYTLYTATSQGIGVKYIYIKVHYDPHICLARILHTNLYQ